MSYLDQARLRCAPPRRRCPRRALAFVIRQMGKPTGYSRSRQAEVERPCKTHRAGPADGIVLR